MASFFIAMSQSWLFATEEYSMTTCLALRSFIEFAVVASFFWSSCIAFYLFYAIVWNKDMMLSEVDSLYLISCDEGADTVGPDMTTRAAKEEAQGKSTRRQTYSCLYRTLFVGAFHWVRMHERMSPPRVNTQYPFSSAAAQHFVYYCWLPIGMTRPRADGSYS